MRRPRPDLGDQQWLQVRHQRFFVVATPFANALVFALALAYAYAYAFAFGRGDRLG